MNYPRWFIVQPNDEQKTLSKLSPFAVSKALKCQIGTLKTVKRLSRGDLLIEVANNSQYETTKKLIELAGCPVKVVPHRSMNSSKGVVRHRELAMCTKEEIIAEMGDQGVTDAVIIKVNQNGLQRPTNTVILSFNTQTPPKYITVGFERVSVAMYIPNPLRCFKCQRYGHGSNNCKNQLACARCGTQGHNDSSCKQEEKCVNCGGHHMASSRDCPKWLGEKRVQQLKVERNISFPEARRLVFEMGTKSAAAVVASGIASTNKFIKRSACTQTDLTWPCDKKSPVPMPTKCQETQTDNEPQPESVKGNNHHVLTV